MEINIFYTFVVVTAFAILSPGASVLLVMSKVASQGMRGQFVVFGFSISVVIYFILSAVGLVAVLTASQTAFNVIKWIGIGYLVYLGLSTIFTKSGGLQVSVETQKTQSAFSLVSQGFLVEFTNPKAWVYFTAIIPPFIDLDQSITIQVMVMIIVSVVLQQFIYFGYGLFAIRVARSGLDSKFVIWLNRVIGLALIFVAIKLITFGSEEMS